MNIVVVSLYLSVTSGMGGKGVGEFEHANVFKVR